MRLWVLISTLSVATVCTLMGCGTAAHAVAAGKLPASMRVASKLDGGPLMFIGGGKDQDDLMREFVHLGGGDASKLVIMPLASDDPAKSGQAYVDYLSQLGYPHARFLVPKGDPDAAATAILSEARGLFWSGGDQTRILAGLTPAWRQAIAQSWHHGTAIAGTSAGAMVWGDSAILDGDPMATGWFGEDPAHNGIRLGAGLGFATGIVVDTHFSQRGRVPRLTYAVAKQAGAVGLGVDPETAAVLLPEGRIEVHGRGTVTVIHVPPQPLTSPLSLTGIRLDVLANGDVLPLVSAP